MLSGDLRNLERQLLTPDPRTKWHMNLALSYLLMHPPPMILADLTFYLAWRLVTWRTTQSTMLLHGCHTKQKDSSEVYRLLKYLPLPKKLMGTDRWLKRTLKNWIWASNWDLQLTRRIYSPCYVLKRTLSTSRFVEMSAAFDMNFTPVLWIKHLGLWND